MEYVGNLEGGPRMWTVIHIVSNHNRAIYMQEQLALEGFLVKIQPVSDKKGYYKILVPGEEAEEAYHILLENGLS